MLTHEKIKVVIADDNREFRQQIQDVVEGQADMEVVGTAADGEEALRLILERKPDIALLDVLMPLEDGFGVLEVLSTKKEAKTACIMVSAINMDQVAKRCLDLGAKYYIMKPCRSAFLVGHIRRIYKETTGIAKEAPDTICSRREMERDEQIRIEQRVTSVLTRLNISPSIKGYYFLKNAIGRVLEDENAIIGITKRMYPEIAKEYKTSASKVERAIRHAIESSWKKGGNKCYEELLGTGCEKKPTNGHFIAAVSEHIRLTTPMSLHK